MVVSVEVPTKKIIYFFIYVDMYILVIYLVKFLFTVENDHLLLSMT